MFNDSIKKKKSLLEIALWSFLTFASIFVGGILIFFTWLIWPIEDFDATRIVSHESNAYISSKLDLKDQGIKYLLTKIEEKYVKNPMEAWIISCFLPSRISGGIIYNTDNPNKPNYIIIADIGWRVRLSSLVRIASYYHGGGKFIAGYSTYNGYKLIVFGAKTTPIAGLAVVQGKIVASNNIELLKKTLDNTQKGSFVEQPSINYLYHTMSQYDSLALINNANGWVTNIIRYEEDKSSYSVFPSIDAVNAIAIGIDIVDEDRINGEIILSQYLQSSSEMVKEDMMFFAAFFRRVLKTYDVDIQSDVTIQNNNVHFIFKGNGFSALWGKL